MIWEHFELRNGLEVKRQKETLEELMNEFMLENVSLRPELPLISFTAQFLRPRGLQSLLKNG